VGLGIRPTKVSVREILEVNITLFALRASHSSKSALKKCKYELITYVMTDAYGLFSYFWASRLLTLAHLGLFNVIHSLVVLIPLFFMLLVDL